MFGLSKTHDRLFMTCVETPSFFTGLKKLRVSHILLLFFFAVLTVTGISGPNDMEGNSRVSTFSNLEDYASFHRSAIRSLPDTGRNRFLIYVCDGECGGVGDRLSGLMSIFYLAIALRRVFLIEYTSPVGLELTLIPNRLLWNSSKLLPSELHSENLNIIDTPDKPGALLLIKKLHSDDSQVIRVKNNRYWLGMYLRLPESDDTENAVGEKQVFLRGALSSLRFLPFEAEEQPTDIFASGFSFLFHFSREVRLRSIEIYRELDVDPTAKYVAIHARIGGRVHANNQVLGWDDPERHKLEDIDEFVSCSKSKAARIEGSPPLVLFSDNEKLKMLASSQKVRTTNSSRLLHVDRSVSKESAKMVRGNIDTFAELMVLSRASCLVGSVSTFSGLASSLLFPPTHCFSFFSSCEESVDFWQETEELF